MKGKRHHLWFERFPANCKGREIRMAGNGKGRAVENLLLAVLGVIIFSYMVAQCQRVAAEKPVPAVSVTVR